MQKDWLTPDEMKELWDAEWQRQLALLPERKRMIIMMDPADSAADDVDEATEKALAKQFEDQGKDWGQR